MINVRMLTAPESLPILLTTTSYILLCQSLSLTLRIDRLNRVFLTLLQNKERPPIATAGSIQEPEKDSELVVFTPHIETKFRFTLEPIMMFLLLGFNVNSECFLLCTLKILFIGHNQLLFDHIFVMLHFYEFYQSQTVVY